MYSVTRRIKAITQPKGGYINRKEFTVNVLEDGIKLNESENIHPSLVGMAVDYMVRFLMGTPKEKAFEISLGGARRAKEEFNSYKLMSKIQGLDSESIVYACKMVGYDVCIRAGMSEYKPVKEINPDQKTVENIMTMIKRGLFFWREYGPIVKDGFTFDGGYTSIISSGDGDYLTKDTMWDFKVLRSEITSTHSLQLLIYYIMGKHSIHKEFDNIEKLGVYNPRLNKVYTLDICKINEDVIDKVSRDVIGYGLSKEKEKEIEKLEEKALKIPMYKSILQHRNAPSDLDKKIYGFSTKDEYIAQAFPTKVKINDNSIYEKSPVFWSGNYIPSIIDRKNYMYIIRFKACFTIKEGKEAFVTNKIGYSYPVGKPLITSDIFNSKDQKYYKYRIDSNGNTVRCQPILILIREDFILFNERYNVEDMVILDGCYFGEK